MIANDDDCTEALRDIPVHDHVLVYISDTKHIDHIHDCTCDSTWYF